jgi:glycosyltransferase involved in cell wall biosynthesis
VKITFLLPGSSHAPIGGFKVIYEYANGLVRAGHDITVVSPAFLDPGAPLHHLAYQSLRYLQRSVDKSYTPTRWFALDPRVKVAFVPTLAESNIPDADVLVASAWQTAEYAARCAPEKGRKFYLIHDYEHYRVAAPDVKKRICATFHAGFLHIVTSPAGEEMVTECGARVDATIANGLDLDRYRLLFDIDSPERTLLGFPYRREPFKGTADAIAALDLVRRRHPQLSIWAFGRPARGQAPAWVHLRTNISDDELATLYNRTQVFVTASHYEGWGLPGSEAMACGAALATTDNGGVHAYAAHDRTALLSPPRDPEKLAANIEHLLTDRELRLRLARAGHDFVQRFDWPSSVRSFERYAAEAAAAARS